MQARSKFCSRAQPRASTWLLRLAPRRLLLTCLLCFTSSPARLYAEEARFSLADALRAMRAQHPLLKNVELSVSAAKADQVVAKLWTNPSLSGSYTAGLHRSSYDNVGYVSYGLTQFLELSNAPGARKRAAALLVAAARADLAATDVQLSLDVEAAIVSVALAERKVALIDGALRLLEQAADVVDKRVLAGASPRYDQARIAVTTATAHADLGVARADQARAWAELRAAVGPGMRALQGTPDYVLEDAAPLPEPSALLEILAQHRPDVEAAKSRARAAEADVSVAKRSVWPGFALSALGGFGAAPGQVDVGVGLAVPVPVLDRGQGAIPAAEARARRALAYRDAVLIPASARLAGMHAEITARRAALEEYTKAAVASGDEMLREAQAGYLAGRFSVLELADAYGAWRESRLRALNLAAAARNAEIDLGRELGKPLRAP
jgi:cobalt-zinc-cadmium efflux system outer membrane protein